MSFYIYGLDQEGVRDIENDSIILKIGSTIKIEQRKWDYFTSNPFIPLIQIQKNPNSPLA